MSTRTKMTTVRKFRGQKSSSTSPLIRAHSSHSRVIGNLKEGQGYADKRKRKFINRYQRFRQKQRLLQERRSNTLSKDVDIEVFAQNINVESEQREDACARTSKEISGDAQGLVGTKEGKGLSSVKERRELGAKGDGGNVKRFKKRGGKKNAKNRFSKAQAEFAQKRQMEEKRMEALRIQQEERTQALEKYRMRKLDNHQKLSKKTRRGQPVMKFQMEVLLDKLKSQDGK